MYKLVFLIIFFNSALFAHECILQGNTPFDIQSYNLCKNDAEKLMKSETGRFFFCPEKL